MGEVESPYLSFTHTESVEITDRLRVNRLNRMTEDYLKETVAPTQLLHFFFEVWRSILTFAIGKFIYFSFSQFRKVFGGRADGYSQKSLRVNEVAPPNFFYFSVKLWTLHFISLYTYTNIHK